jgi:protein tyrosine/serine phosphatase
MTQTTPLDSMTNFRDFGGHSSTLGGRMATDRLYRCGHLQPVGAGQAGALDALRFTLVIDLRHAQERRRVPVPWPEHRGITVLTLSDPIAGDAPHRSLLRSGPKTADDIDRFYQTFYRELPFHPGYRDLFARALLALATHPGRTLVYCAAGKDRTGTLVALIHHMLGVPPADLLADYMRSQESFALATQRAGIMAEVESRLGYRLDEAAARKMMGVEPHYLESAFSAIRVQCGSVEGYFEQAGFAAAHRALLLEQLLSESGR